MSIRLHQVRWPAADLAARVAEYEAVVCVASLLDAGARSDEWAEVLNAPERERLAGYTNAVVARRFAASRCTTREILGSLLGLAPRDVPLREGLHGKPYLAAGTAGRVWFSISHTDDLLVVALSRVADVGVDVELSRAFEQWQRVADRVLDAHERRQLHVAVEHGADPGEAFLRQWCRVEAELKAIGCGIQGLEAHRAGARPRGLRLADLSPLLLPHDIAATGLRYQAAVALCVPEDGATVRRESLRQSIPDNIHVAPAVTRPPRTSTP